MERPTLASLRADWHQLLLNQESCGPSKSEEHEYEWVVDIGIVAENWPASPKVFAIWRQPTEARHTEETRRYVNISICIIKKQSTSQVLWLTTCQLSPSSASLSPPPPGTSSLTPQSGSRTLVSSRRPRLSALSSNTRPISSTNHGGKLGKPSKKNIMYFYSETRPLLGNFLKTRRSILYAQRTL